MTKKEVLAAIREAEKELMSAETEADIIAVATALEYYDERLKAFRRKRFIL